MCYLKIGFKGFTIAVLMVFMSNGFAKSYHWDNISQQKYIDNLVSCETQLQEYKWSKNLWPKENKKAKPAFSTVLDTDKIRQKVLNNLYKQNILFSQFNSDINQAMLQHDINRMSRTTKDAEGLKAMYALFDYDALTIAHCISRPYLVDKQLQNRYNQNTDIHQKTRIQAKLELDDYLDNKIDLVVAQISTVTFKIKQDEIKSGTLTKEPSEETIIELDKEQYQQKLKELENKNLQEKNYAFIYSEIVQEYDNSIIVKNLVWQKIPLDKWLKNQKKHIRVVNFNKEKFIITAITGSKNKFDKAKAATADTWKPHKEYRQRQYHSSVWTGTEMVVWGGSEIGFGGSIVNTGIRYNPSSDSWTSTSIIGAPISRYFHTAVWTGTEMIIWGGYDGGNYLNSGSRYNPNNDSWTVINTNGAPTGRDRHTAVWSGTEMIVWGGYDGSNAVNSGNRYNPNNDSWTAINTNGAPTGRTEHTAVWTGTEMIIWGGNFENTGGRYNPSNDSWTSTNIMGAPSARSRHTVVWTGTEMIIWGGHYNDVLNTGGRYDPSNDSWIATGTNAAILAGKYLHTAVWTGTEMIIWGGLDTYGNSSRRGLRYNPSADSWIAASYIEAPTARSRHSAVWTGTEMIVWGGSGTFTNTGGRYSPSSDSWSMTSAFGDPTFRGNHTAVWTGAEMIIWGGFYGEVLNTGGRYNPSSDSWIATSTIGAPIARYLHTAVWTGSEMIIWGGNVGNSTNTGSRYNPNSDSWIETNTIGAPIARYWHTAVWTGTEMIIWGGRGNTGILNTGSRYNPDTDSWTTISTSGAPVARVYHTSVWADNEMIVWGGSNSGSIIFNSGGRYNPSSDSWTATSTFGAPLARSNHTAVWTGTEMIVWGGSDSGFLNTNTGGRYSPSSDSWTATSTFGAPTARSNYTVVWTGTDMIVWGGGSIPYTGARYNPNNDNWIATSTIGVGTGRQGHTAVWTGTEMIVWGGSGGIDPMGIYSPYNTYNVSGTLSGLAGDHVVLQNNAGNYVILTENSNFSFSVVEGGNYAVTVLSSPTSPAQTCDVTNGIGTNVVMDISNITVLCVTNKYNINVSVTGLAATNSISFTNGTDSLVFNTNSTEMLSNLIDGTTYTVLVSGNQPDTPTQTCIFTNANIGALSGADVTITVYCNTPPVTTANTYTAFEDINLIVNDADGSVAGVNDDSVLVNDNDVDGDSLSVVNPGVFTAIGLGGEITIAADGTFSYVPPADVSGQDTLDFNVSDGIHTMASTLTIDVLPVNDAPSFSIQGDVLNASAHPNFVSNSLSIAAYASNFVMGPADESSQSVAAFIPSIFADSGSVLAVNGVTVNNAGDLTLNFTSNLGVAIVQLQLQDDGATTNGGEDTSVAQEFVVSYNHVVFIDGFETPVVVKLFEYLDAVKAKSPLRDYPSYDFENNTIVYKGHRLHLNESLMTNEMMQVIKMWTDEIDKIAN